MVNTEIHQISSRDDPRIFTLSEAELLFPLVRKLTQATYQELEPVRRALEAMVPTNPMIQDIERQYEVIVKRWVGKMERLGLVVKGLWLVDFDTGDGYLCWKFPELRIGYYHSYHEGYSGRIPLRQVVEELDPDWAHA
jgi:hypothetical protein